jgi:hypothetical protein
MDWNHTFSSWGKIKHGVPHVSILGPSFFLLYRKVLSKIINNKSKPILFADDSSIIITNPCPIDFKNDIYTVCEYIINGLKSNYSH